jgi:uncharacterized membrane protein (DUF106 family)
MYDWLLNNALFVLLVLCTAVITIGLIVTVLNKVRRAEFFRLQDEIKELSEQVKALEVAEQRRFLRELKSHSEGSEPSLSTNVRLLKSEMEPKAAPPLTP